ncbi:ABC-type transport auxiliary lipoprotein family protein [Marinobacter sp. F3R08]|uniref:ABC-type transport auxiliary lipoprotein family protein n=1 Tax=Marinobacter sp. F3R08 TaxID=2841559 RepID=UPI001C090129|nr:ABC-type transport auxiliary lipoprotein family protein [Marinobacter sp. F3R08]MBU2956010.1 membrane integrity-associated transporter subunit PqiC [Marinobacter sp. F3R08]
MTLSSIRNVIFVLAVALTGGCTVFPNLEPPRVMDLALGQSVAGAQKPIRAALRVDTPYASEPFNSSLILAKPTPREFRAYPETRWRDAAPVVVRDALVNRIRQSGTYTTVITDTNPAQAELTLVTELSAFHAQNPESRPEVIIELHLQMVHNRSRATLCTRTVRIVESASGSSVDQIVTAFGTAGSKLAASVIEWARRCDYPSRLMPSQETDRARQP